MASLVEELQHDALDSSVSVSGMLRKAKAIAVKLDLPELEKQVESKLNGYRSAEIPVYRIVFGQVKHYNPFHGWQSVIFHDTASEATFARQKFHESVAELESLSANANGRELMIRLSAETKQTLMNGTNSDEDFTIVVSATVVDGILNAVRNALLEWSLRLEKSGVRGDGMSFSDDERKRAYEAQITYNIGSIQTFTGHSSVSPTTSAI